jgi:hypothetical protein
MEENMKKHILFTLFFYFAFSSLILSQIPITTSGNYIQDFNSLADTGSSSVLPTGWYIFENGSAADSAYIASNGSGIGGNTFSYGSLGSTERALGGLQTGTLIPSFGSNFINNTGDVITFLHITYFGEQWRVGVTDRGEADRFDFQYSINATSLSDGIWTDINQLDLVSPFINTTSGAKDGNSSENRVEITYTITGLSIPEDSEFWIRWTDYNAPAQMMD